MTDSGAPPTPPPTPSPALPLDEESPVRRLRAAFPRWIVPLTVFVGLALTTVSWKITHSWESEQLNVLLGDKAAEQISKIDHETDDATDILLALRALFASRGTVDAGSFKVFVAEHLRSFPEVIALSWLQRVRALERDDFEAHARPDGQGNFEIVESAPTRERTHVTRRDEYFPVTFVEPVASAARNERSFGNDHAALPDRLAAIKEACRTGRLVVAGPTAFVDFAEGLNEATEDRGEIHGEEIRVRENRGRAFVCYLPIFAGGGVPATAEERDARMLGCVAATFEVDGLFAAAARSMRLETMSLHTFVDDGFGAGGRRTPVWKSADDGVGDDYDQIRALHGVDEHRLVWGNRCFRVLARPNGDFASAAVVTSPWFALLVGLGATGAAALIVYRLGSERSRLSREVRQFWKMTSEMLSVMDHEGHLRRVNPAWTALLGRSEADLISNTLPDLVHPEDRAVTEDALQHLLQGIASVTFEARLRSGDAEWHWLRWNAAPSEDRLAIHAVASDVTGERSTIEQLEERASIDSLTGVLTRRALFDRLAAEFERARRYAAPLSVAVLDLDHFKQINDRHGHVMGDALLRRLGQLLKKSLRATDSAGRYGGDEFVLVLPESDFDSARQTSERLLEMLAREGAVALPDGKSLKLRASLGVAELAPDITDVAMLVARADSALYRAKRAGRNRVA